MPTDIPPKDPREYLPLLAGLDAAEEDMLDFIHRIRGFAEGLVDRAFEEPEAATFGPATHDLDSNDGSAAVGWEKAQTTEDNTRLVGQRPCGEDTIHDE